MAHMSNWSSEGKNQNGWEQGNHGKAMLRACQDGKGDPGRTTDSKQDR